MKKPNWKLLRVVKDRCRLRANALSLEATGFAIQIISHGLREYFQYYNHSRAHQSLDGNAPLPREPEPPDRGKVIAIPQVGGLHHRYTRVAA